MASELLIDPEEPGVVHASVTCPALFGLVEAVEAAAGGAVADPDTFLDVAADLGYVIPAGLAHGLRPCPCCVLVAEPVWAAAA